MRTLRQIPKVVGQTDAGETIYEVRSARLVLRGDAAHFNRLVQCSKCGREVPGRAVLGPADLEQPPQAVVCNDCVEAATDLAARTDAPAFAGAEGMAQPVGVDDPALADAQAEMNLGPAELVDELAEPPEDLPEHVVPDAGGLGDEADEAGVEVALEDEAPPAVEEPVADAAGEEEPAPVAEAAGEEEPAPVDESPVPEDGGGDEEPPAPAPLPLVAVTHLDDTEMVSTPAPPGDDGLLRRRLDLLEERLGAHTASGGAGADPLRVAALEEMIQRLDQHAASQVEHTLAMQVRLDQLAAGVEAAQGKKETDKLRRRLDQMGERLEQLQGALDAEWARAKSESASLGQALTELGERVLRLAEQAGESAGAGDERLAAVEEKVDEVDARLAEAVAAIPQGPAPAPDNHDSRFRALERQISQSRGEVGELNELHAALDAGLGVLRGELAEVRTGLARLADSKADLDDRLETFVRMSLVPEGEKGRKGKKAAESSLGTLSAAVQDLIREQRQLKDAVTNLEQVSDAATAAATRASMQASSLGPLRGDVKLLHQELVEQQEAIDDLRVTVERLRRAPGPPPAPAPAAQAPPKQVPAKYTATAKKVAPAAKKAAPAKGTTARAALAKAAAEQAAADKAAPAKRAPRARKG